MQPDRGLMAALGVGILSLSNVIMAILRSEWGRGLELSRCAKPGNGPGTLTRRRIDARIRRNIYVLHKRKPWGDK